MNKAQLQDQIAPGSVGLALATIYMTYGEWAGFVPTDLTEVKFAALTAAVGVVCAALVNIIRRFTTKPQAKPAFVPVLQTEAERRMPDREETKP